MKKELIVCDNFGKQVQIGDIIVFVETFKYRGIERYGSALTVATVMEITNRRFKLAPVYFSKDEYEALKKRGGYAVYSPSKKQYISTEKKFLEHQYNAFYIVGHGDGSVVLNII